MSSIRSRRAIASCAVLSVLVLLLAGCPASSDSSLMTWSDVESRSWKPLGAAGTYGLIYSTSVGFDAGGNLFCAVQDSFSGLPWATVLWYNDGAWAPLGNSRFSPGEADSLVLGIDRGSNYWVAFCDPYVGLYVMEFSGGAWTIVGTGPISMGLASDAAIAFDSYNTPYVAYADHFMSGRLSVQKWDGAAWSYVGSPGMASPEAAAYTAMAADTAGHICVAYQDYDGGGLDLSAVVWDATSYMWKQLGSRGFSQTSVADVSIAVDPTGVPYVGFVDVSEGQKASVMKLSGGVWTYVGARGFTPDQARGLKVAIDKWGTPYVGYVDHSAADKASAMVLRGSAWTTLGTAGFSDGEAAYLSMAVSPDGSPVLTYEDRAHGYMLTGMSYY